MITASVNTLENPSPAVHDLPAEQLTTTGPFIVPQRPLRAYHHWKSILDRTTAMLLLIPGVPMIAVLMVLIKITSRGPAIYSQERVGKDGRRHCEGEGRSCVRGLVHNRIRHRRRIVHIRHREAECV